jgi:hypothetical protein
MTTLIDATDLFPQLGGYDVYAGGCEMNNPANQYWGDGNYFDNHPASHVDLDPGDSFVDVDAVLPILTVNVTRQKREDVWVQIDQNDAPATGITCQDEAVDRDNTGIWIAKSSSTSTTAETVSKSIPLPFGTYRICVDDNNTSSTGWRRKSTGGSVSDAQLYTATTVSKTLDFTSGTPGTSKCVDPFP